MKRMKTMRWLLMPSNVKNGTVQPVALQILCVQFCKLEAISTIQPVVMFSLINIFLILVTLKLEVIK